MALPRQVGALLAPIPEAERGDMMAAYRRRLTGPSPEARIEAARAWSLWEGETITLLPNAGFSELHAEDRYALAFSRIENHYFVNGGFFAEAQLLRDAGRLKPSRASSSRAATISPRR